MRPLRATLAVLLATCIVAGTTAAELEITGPTKAAPGQLVMLSVGGIGPGELADCRLLHWPTESVSVIPATTWSGQPFVLFNAAEPGTYLLVVFLQQPGGGYAGHGVTVADPQPGPGPEPSPGPDPGPQRLSLILVIEETSQRTPSQAAVVTNAPLREWLLNQKLAFRALDRDQAEIAPAAYAPYFRAAAKGGSYPVCFLVGDDGSAIKQGPLPSTVDEFRGLIESLLED